VDAGRLARKRRTIGFRSDRDTWVRIEARPVDKITGQGWNGIECSALLDGVARPEWFQSVSWRDGDWGWRADETELITASPIHATGILTVEPDLSERWWATLTSSLSALARHTTTRVATPGMQPITQQRVISTIHAVFPGIDTTVGEWCTAHGDLAWVNLTGPVCVLLDWEDWGTAPRGWDAAMLWLYSLPVPALADRVYAELRTELDTPSGLLSQLAHCAEVMAWPGYEKLSDPAKQQTERIIAQLTHPA
jgi:hypothetical protein